MRWFDLDDGDDELGVLELENGLELVALASASVSNRAASPRTGTTAPAAENVGGVVLWAWRDDAGRMLGIAERAQA